MIPGTPMFQEFEGERWTINELFLHVANEEWWYLDCIGLVDCIKVLLPTDPMMRLAHVRENLFRVLPRFEKKHIFSEFEGEI